MSGADIQQWLLTVTAIVSAVTISFSILVSLRELKLKFRAETQRIRSQQLEDQIKLHMAFGELMRVAHARGEQSLSETAVEHALAKYDPDSASATEGAKEISAIARAAGYLSAPVGMAQQQAAIASIIDLGCAYPELRLPLEVALQELSSFVTFNERLRDLVQERELQ